MTIGTPHGNEYTSTPLQKATSIWQAFQCKDRSETSPSHELLRLLAQVGFGEVPVHGDYTEAEATAEHGILIFIARK
jgi:hypothetical protein